MNALRKRELLLSLKYATIEACFSVPMLNLTTSNLPFAIGFAVKVLGWNPAAIGLMAATPHLCNFLQPPLTFLLQKRLSLYKIMLLGFTLNAAPWAFFSGITMLPQHTSLVFALVVFLSSLSNSVCAVAWSSSMSQLVPLNIRGRYFGKRMLIFSFWTLVAVLAAGQYADKMNNSLAVFGVVFGAASAARLIGMFFLTRMKFPDSVMQRQTDAAALMDYLSVFKDRVYLVLLLYIGLWGFFLNIGMPFYSVYVLKELHLGLGDLTFLTTVSGIGGLISMKAWGVLSDKFGNKPVLTTCSILWACFALLSWIFAGPERHYHLYLNYLVVGFMTAGFQLCQFNLMIKLVPTETKSHYISVFFAFTSLLTAFGPIVGGKLLNLIPPVVGSFLGQPVTNYHLLFAGSLLLCLVSVNLLQWLREPAVRPVRELVRVMRNMREFNPLLSLASFAEFMFTPREIGRFAHQYVRSLKRHTGAVSDVGEELVEGGWKALRNRIERKKPK